MFSRDARTGYSDINCFIVRLNVQDGVATSETLILDTPNTLASGTATIDLKDEVLDIFMKPEAKQKRLVATITPFAITGPLSSPTLKFNPVGAAARVVGDLAFAPLNVLGTLLPLVNDGGKDEENPCLTLGQGPSRQ
jgi:hypothetical protein